jgi:hypothetical protein
MIHGQQNVKFIKKVFILFFTIPVVKISRNLSTYFLFTSNLERCSTIPISVTQLRRDHVRRLHFAIIFRLCSIESPARCTWIYMYSLFLYIFALHVSGAICTHHQEHKLQNTAICVCNGYGMLIHWSMYWLGHTVRVSQPVPAPMD